MQYLDFLLLLIIIKEKKKPSLGAAKEKTRNHSSRWIQ